MPEEPVVIGFEGVGIVEGVGEEVTEFKTGDRVAYGIPPLGSYSEVRNYPTDKLLHLPKNLDDGLSIISIVKDSLNKQQTYSIIV